MKALKWQLELSGVLLPENIHIKAAPGDLALVRLANASFDRFFVFGAVAETHPSGAVAVVRFARRRKWTYDHQINVAAQTKLRGHSAEQIALALPNIFDTPEAAKAALNDYFASARVSA